MTDTWVIVFDNGGFHCSVGHGHETQELREARTYPSEEDAERDAATLEGVARCDTLARLLELTMPRCKNCKHYSPMDDRGEAPHGKCSSPKFMKSYHTGFGRSGFDEDGDDRIDVTSDMVIVEPDEGWGFRVGTDFGCIHFAVREVVVQEQCSDCGTVVEGCHGPCQGLDSNE